MRVTLRLTRKILHSIAVTQMNRIKLTPQLRSNPAHANEPQHSNELKCHANETVVPIGRFGLRPRNHWTYKHVTQLNRIKYELK